MLEVMPKLLEDKRIDILTMTFIFIQKIRTVGGPLLWEALGRGLLGLCQKMALLARSIPALAAEHDPSTARLADIIWVGHLRFVFG